MLFRNDLKIMNGKSKQSLRIEIHFLFNLQRFYHNFNLKICSTQLKLNFKTMKAFHVKKILQYNKTISLEPENTWKEKVSEANNLYCNS